MISPLFAGLGAVGWSLSEYAIHRFVGHGPKRARPERALSRIGLEGLAYEFNREHLAHHTDPTYFAPTSHKALAATVGLVAMTCALTPFLGLRRAGSFAAGFAAAYGGYEVLHRRLHTRGPTTAYGRWARLHHLAHHYRSPRENHGVTSPVWDHVFKTHREGPAAVRVPQRSAPSWMLDAGRLRPELASDYELVGSPLGGSSRRGAGAGASQERSAGNQPAPLPAT